MAGNNERQRANECAPRRMCHCTEWCSSPRRHPTSISRDNFSSAHTSAFRAGGTRRLGFSIGQSWEHRASSTWPDGPVIGCKCPGLPFLPSAPSWPTARKSKTNRKSASPRLWLSVSGSCTLRSILNVKIPRSSARGSI